MPPETIISNNWGTDPQNSGYCLSARLLVGDQIATQRVFLADMEGSLLKRWRQQARDGEKSLAQDFKASLIYAEASYLRYDSVVFRQNRTNDWLLLLATRTNAPDYTEQTFLLASTNEAECRIQDAIGICLVRRSWANNLFIDYLAISPRSYTAPRLKGIPQALICTLVLMGVEMGCEYLYLEPSRRAVPFYEKLLGPPIGDLEKIPIKAALNRVAKYANVRVET
jgi:hypothetical protein